MLPSLSRLSTHVLFPTKRALSSLPFLQHRQMTTTDPGPDDECARQNRLNKYQEKVRRNAFGCCICCDSAYLNFTFYAVDICTLCILLLIIYGGKETQVNKIFADYLVWPYITCVLISMMAYVLGKTTGKFRILMLSFVAKV